MSFVLYLVQLKKQGLQNRPTFSLLALQKQGFKQSKYAELGYRDLFTRLVYHSKFIEPLKVLTKVLECQVKSAKT